MGQNPSWEANRFSASQEIPHILWNPKVHHRIHKRSPTVRTLSQLDPVHATTFHPLNIHPNIFLPSTPGSPHWSLSLRFPHQNPIYASPLPLTRYMPCPSHYLEMIHDYNCVKTKFLFYFKENFLCIMNSQDFYETVRAVYLLKFKHWRLAGGGGTLFKVRCTV
jgi:hypothetical protein